MFYVDAGLQNADYTITLKVVQGTLTLQTTFVIVNGKLAA